MFFQKGFVFSSSRHNWALETKFSLRSFGPHSRILASYPQDFRLVVKNSQGRLFLSPVPSGAEVKAGFYPHCLPVRGSYFSLGSH